MPRKRSMKGYLKGRIDESSGDLGALAQNAGIIAVFDETVNGRTKVSSIVVAIHSEDLTGGEGPLEVLVCHSDYSLAEVEEYIENTGSWNAGDTIQSREVARRLVRSLGMLSGDEPTIADGRARKHKLNWTLEQGQTLDLVVYNHGAQLTTGGEVFATGHANLWAA